MTLVAVLEVGGTHATASWVDTAGWTVLPEFRGRARLRGDADADDLLEALAGCVAALGATEGATLAVAIPGPFDYPAGIGRYRDVGKFDALAGVDVGAGLAARLPGAPDRIVFLNDAAAFGLGEWLVGAARDCERAVALTLGTGVGSAFVDGGTIVADGPRVPPDGYVYRLTIEGAPLESVMSRRAILASYRAAGGEPRADVREIAARAERGDHAALRAFTEPLRRCGAAIAPWLERFGAQVLVVGGAMSDSWTLVEPALRAGLAATGAPAGLHVEKARDVEAAAAIGAAWHAVRDVEAPARGVPAVTGDEKR